MFIRFARRWLPALIAAALLASCSGAPPPSTGESWENYQEGHAKHGQ